jgi:hypothetical protein
MRTSYLCCLGALLLLSSCAKEINYLKTHTDNPDRVCRIRSFRYYAPYVGWDTITLTYNQYGNPIRGDRKPGVTTGYPAFEFRYDRDQYLTDYIGIFPGGGLAEFWHRYTHDNRGRIVIDSQYTFTTVVNNQLGVYDDLWVTLLTYDRQDRVATAAVSVDMDHYTLQYNYDREGNLMLNPPFPGGRVPVYDDKIAYRRTNPVWMFLDRDYSLNNSFTADSYNAFGLPTVIGNLADLNAGYDGFFYNYYSVMELDYACPDIAGHTK